MISQAATPQRQENRFHSSRAIAAGKAVAEAFSALPPGSEEEANER